MYRLLELNPQLQPFAGDIDLRMFLYRATKNRLLPDGGTLLRYDCDKDRAEAERRVADVSAALPLLEAYTVKAMPWNKKTVAITTEEFRKSGRFDTARDTVAEVLALRDTGNSLRDPVTGDAVLILASEAAQRLTGLTEQQIASPVETLTIGTLPGLRLIPYRAVGQGGLLLGMKLNCVIDGRESSTVVAFDPGGLGKETMYQALTGGV